MLNLNFPGTSESTFQKGFRMLDYLHKVTREATDRGASAVEYGLMVAAIAAVIVSIVFGLGQLVSGTFNSTCSAMRNAPAHTAVAGTDCNSETSRTAATP
jgi:pilus assembly protein Flp/PilA